MTKNDTVAAISTPSGIGGIGVIRISGPEAFSICDKVFSSPSSKKLADAKTHTIHYGHIKDENGETVDEVMAAVMRAPKTFTAEDTVEISAHGSPVALNKILSLLIGAGARLAEPGEFTKRAFLNGRIDLSRAEAVIDVIHSDSFVSLKNAVSQLDGSLYRRIEDIKEPLLYAMAQLAAAVDYPDEEIATLTPPELEKILSEAIEKTEELIKSADDGRIIKDGVVMVILGKPNVGKSSLMNALVGADRSIVTDIEGTTRDIIEDKIVINGVSVRLFDTAGIRSASDEVEKIGVRKTLDYLESADIAVVMLDSSSPLDDKDKEVLRSTEGKKRIIILNKSDLPAVIKKSDIGDMSSEDDIILLLSAKNEDGIIGLKDAVSDLLNLGKVSASQRAVSNMRHVLALSDAKEALSDALGALRSGLPPDMCSIDISTALESLGLIDGRTVSADIVDEVFRNFCVGK